MSSNPFTAIDQLLSKKGLETLKNKYYPPVEVEWFEPEDGGEMYGIGTTPELSEDDSKHYDSLVRSGLINQLEMLTENLLNEIDSKIFELETDKERKAFCHLMTKRLDITINRWRTLPASTNHPDTFPILDNFREHLKSLATALLNDEDQPSDQLQHAVPLIQLPENLNLYKLGIKADKLDIYQTALLFHYLRQAEVFINYTDSSLAQLAHVLTGHSKQNLRTEKGLGMINSIIRDKIKNKEHEHSLNYNLLTIKSLLEDLLIQVNSDIESNNQRTKK